MDREIYLVGCGFLGRQFVEALGRLTVAAAWREFSVFLMDPDSVELRNVAAQGYDHAEVGLSKARLCALRLRTYGVDASYAEVRVQDFGWYTGARLVIDCTDNLVARRFIDEKAFLGHTILHVGLTGSGEGVLEWTSPDRESTYSLAEGDAPPQQELPPCQLAGFALCGQKTAMMAAIAVLQWLGCPTDFTGHFPFPKQGRRIACRVIPAEFPDFYISPEENPDVQKEVAAQISPEGAGS